MSKVLPIMITTTSVSGSFPTLSPTQLSEKLFEGFPSLISEMKPEGGAPYLLCNEERQDKTLAALPKGTAQDGGSVHLGFSVWFNLDLIAQTKPSRAVICDIDPHVIELYKAFEQILERCDTPLDFADEMNRYILGKPFAYYDFKDELQRKGSWLSSQKSYVTVRQMCLEGRIYFGYLNLADRGGLFDQIGKWLQRQNLYVQTLYISNIFVWLKKANMETLTQGSANIMKVVSHRTQTIHAFSAGGDEKNPLIQEVVSGDAAKGLADKIWNLKPAIPKPLSKRSELGDVSIPKFRFMDDE